MAQSAVSPSVLGTCQRSPFPKAELSTISPELPPSPTPAETQPTTRCGIVALAGLPNAGKSTLLNALMGERLSIVTAKAQTTRKPVTGIRSDPETQVIFKDTPGLLRAENLLQRSMRAMAQKEMHEADAIVLVIDAASGAKQEALQRLGSALEGCKAPRLAVLNKTDRATRDSKATLAAWAADTLNADVVECSALSGEGVEEVWEWIVARMPVSPFLYDPEDLSSDNLRFFVAELVRETVFELYRQDIPYGIVCTVDEFRQSEDPVFIRVVIHVERNSQKGIVIGKRGAGIRELGQRSRAKIETLVGAPVYLDLWVKVLEGWRSRGAALKQLGFPVPEDEPTK